MTSTPTAKSPKKQSKSYSVRPTSILREAHAPAVIREAERRAGSVQLRVADAITSFAGSMKFVYVHVVIFAAWMLWFEASPWPTLTLVVSLEAIFLSQEKELDQNTELTKEIHRLTQELHAKLVEAQTK
jgi:uncharacterized membrane protein